MKFNQIKTKEEFEQAIKSDKITVFKFFGAWCGPCKVLSSVMEAMPDVEGVTIYEIDVDDCDEEIVANASIRNIPTLLFYKEGFQQGRLCGMVGKEAVENKIKELID